MGFRNSFQRMLAAIFAGRCGFDVLSRFLLRCSLLPLLLSLLFYAFHQNSLSLACYFAGMVLFIWSVWRAFSHNLSRRAAENAYFQSSRFYTGLSGAAIRFSQRRDYRFFRCPGCRRWLRVPRGRGRVEIRCPSCGSRFRGST